MQLAGTCKVESATKVTSGACYVASMASRAMVLLDGVDNRQFHGLKIQELDDQRTAGLLDGVDDGLEVEVLDGAQNEASPPSERKGPLTGAPSCRPEVLKPGQGQRPRATWFKIASQIRLYSQVSRIRQERFFLNERCLVITDFGTLASFPVLNPNRQALRQSPRDFEMVFLQNLVLTQSLRYLFS